MRRITFALCLMIVGLPPLQAAGADSGTANWPAWRGPLATGVAPQGDPPITWSETQNVKWKVAIPGTGKGTPIIWDDLVFVQTAIPAGKKAAPASEAPAASRPGGAPRAEQPTESYQFVLLCLNRRTGQTIWQKTLREQVPHEGHHPADGSFASASPVTDGQRVIAYFGSRGLYCLDFQGTLKWSKDLGRMRIKMAFGEGSSPALHDGKLVVNWDHEGPSFIAAFDADSGRELWRQPRDEATSWATPLIVSHDGQTEVITSATRKIRSYDLGTGKLLWECGGMTQNVIPTPVAGEGLVFAISGFRGSALLAIRLGRTGDLTGTEAIVWQHHKSTPYVPSPLLYGNRLYFLANNNGLLSCFDAKTGKALIDAERLEALPGVYASPVGARDRVYLLGRNGAVLVLKAADQLEILATNRLDDKFDASPAIAGRELYLRGMQNLYCLAGD